MATGESVRKPELRVEAGVAKPSRLRLTRNSYTIGASPDCDIVAQGGKVSDLHATLELGSDGGWLVRNKSNFGILVNRRPADVVAISPGDSIQIGDSVLLGFRGRVARAEAAADAGDEAGRSGVTPKQIAIGALVGLYLLAIGGVMVFLSSGGRETEARGLTADYLEQVMDATGEHLEELRLPAGGVDPGAVQAASLYHRIGLGPPGAERERDIAALLQRIDRLMFQAWLLEQRGDLRDALGVYRQVEKLVPDVRAPVTRVALWRIDEIRGGGR